MEGQNWAGVVGGWIYLSKVRIHLQAVLKHCKTTSGSEYGE